MTSPTDIEEYVYGAMDAAEAERFEDALFAKPQPSVARAAREVLDLADAIRGLETREVSISMTCTLEALDAFEARGHRIQRQLLRDGDALEMRVDATSDLVVAVLALDLEGVHRVDLDLIDPDGTSRGVHAVDVDVDRVAKCVIVPCDPSVALASAATLFRLHAHRADGRRTTHDYTVTHAR